MAGGAEAGLVLSPAGGTGTITDNPLSFHTPVVGMVDGPVGSGVYRDLIDNNLTFVYSLGIPLLEALEASGDELAISGFGDVVARYSFGMMPYGGPVGAVPPIPFSMEASGDTLTMGDFRRAFLPALPIAMPLEVRLFTDATAWGAGTATRLHDGEAVATYDVLVPIAAPEPSTIALAASAVPIGLVCWRRWCKAATA